MKQVNYSEKVSGESYYWISNWSNNGFVGETIDTQYADGADTTDWCLFVGTEEDCKAYISSQGGR